MNSELTTEAITLNEEKLEMTVIYSYINIGLEDYLRVKRGETRIKEKFKDARK